jgi:uncharacterized protein
VSFPDGYPETSTPPPDPAETIVEARTSSPVQAEQSLTDASNRAVAQTDAISVVSDPPWTGWDVLAIVLAGVVAFFVFAFLAVGMTRGATFQEKANRFVTMPEWGLGVQALAELAVLGCMYLVVASRTGGASFWQTVRWNWPVKVGLYLLIGFLMQAAFLVVERFLPFPKNTPFDAVLRRPYSLMAITVFSVTLGPLMEELLFRGFLYPLLRKHFGVLTAILGTALPFGLVHLSQYGYSWASGVLIFMVGVVLATVREKANSLAAGFLVHVAYNGVIVALLFAATDGFQHLEKLNQ